MGQVSVTSISHRGLLGRILRLPLKLIPPGACIPVIQGPLRGKKWIVGSGIHGCWLGTYESVKQKAFSAEVKSGDIVYDLGANVGYYTLIASDLVGPQGKVFSFEPAPRNLQFIRKHLALNRITNCTVLAVAVGNTEGTAFFDFGLSGYQGHLAHEADSAVTVDIVTLDGLVNSGKLPPPNIIKCDIEGAEFDALKGASQLLAEHGPTIFLATHGTEVHEQCCELLTDLGYVLASVDDLPLSQTHEIVARRQQTDAVTL